MDSGQGHPSFLLTQITHCSSLLVTGIDRRNATSSADGYFVGVQISFQISFSSFSSIKDQTRLDPLGKPTQERPLWRFQLEPSYFRWRGQFAWPSSWLERNTFLLTEYFLGVPERNEAVCTLPAQRLREANLIRDTQ